MANYDIKLHQYSSEYNKCTNMNKTKTLYKMTKYLSKKQHGGSVRSMPSKIIISDSTNIHLLIKDTFFY